MINTALRTEQQLTAVTSTQSEENHPLSLNIESMLLKSFIEECIEKNARGKEQVLKLASEFDVRLSYTRIRQLVKSYTENKESALVKKKRKDADTHKNFSEEVLLQMQKFFVECRNAKLVYENTHKWLRQSAESFIHNSTGEEFRIVAGRLCEIRDEKEIISMYTSNPVSGTYITEAGPMKIGSERSAVRYLKYFRDNHADELHYAKFGVEDYRLKRQHSMKLNYSHLEPNECISGDNKVVDVLVISEDWRSIFRPWLSCWYDLSTRRFCYDIGRSPNAELTTNSLVKAMSEWGIPKEINHDRGSDYLSGLVQNLAKALSLGKRISKRKLARAKPVESFFAGLDLKLLDLPGATGNKYKEMPQRTRELLMQFTKIKNEFDKHIEKLYDKTSDFELSLNREREGRLKSSRNRFMHITEFVEILDKKLDEYHSKVHRGLKADKLGREAYKLTCEDETIKELGERINTPAGRYEYKVMKGFQPVFASPDSLAMFTTRFDLRIVQISKGVSFNNDEYFDPKLKRLAGQRVMIRYTSVNTSALYVYHSESLQKVSDKKYITSAIIKDLKFICIAKLVSMVDYNDPAYKDHLAIQRAEEKRLKETISSKPQITRLSGNESETSEIKKAELQLMQNSKLNNAANDDGEWRDLYDVS